MKPKAKRMEDEFLPGLENLKHKLGEQEEDDLFYKRLHAAIGEEEACNLYATGRFTEREMLGEFQRLAKRHQLELPTSIKRQLRRWKGQDRYKQLKKSKGSKYDISLIEEIQRVIPLSLKGFDFSFGKSSVKWKRESDNKEFTLYLPIDKAGIMRPAVGDLAKRVIMATFRFAVARRTRDPGPITFEQFLDILGERRASQEKRKRIKDICESCAHTSLEIRRTHDKKKGQEGYFRYTPFFKDYIWKGDYDFSAIIYPVINERFERMLVEENLSRYIWFEDARLQRLPRGMTDRDRLAQDQFKMFLGLPVIRFRMRNWLVRFGQFVDKEIRRFTLADIKEFVNKNVVLAREGGLVERVRIHKYQKKETYLAQTISIYPAAVRMAKARCKLSIQEQQEVAEITDWLYEVGVEDYAEIDRKAVEEYIRNAAEYGYLPCLHEAYEMVEGYEDADYPVDEQGDYANRPMKFWLAYQACRSRRKE